MLNISFYLREPRAQKETPIVMRMVLGGKQLKYSTNERIHTDLWDAERQRTKNVRRNLHSIEINAFLENLNNMAVTAYRDYQFAHRGKSPSLDDIKISLDKNLGRSVEFKTDLFGFFEKLIARSESGVRARRSFATNEYLAGTPTLTIMAITGHKKEKAFLRYIKLVPSDHARLLKDYWEKEVE
ncbi:MAG TPA: hypothetical protein VFE32_20370 [Puia sp.]|jgi:hypothetical protein|nr:hypothetical protein [Puia sp.]